MSNEEPPGSSFFVAEASVVQGRDRHAGRAAVFIDGSNLHHRLHDCGWPTRIDIVHLAGRLAGGRVLTGVHYYDVPPPPILRPEQIAQQQRYYARVEADPRVSFVLGHLQERRVRGTPVYEEKGADVSLAIDMVTGAFEDRYEVGILVSSDGDFAPAVQEVRRRGKRVEYVYFPQGPRSRALQQASDLSRCCRRGWIVPLGLRLI